MKLLLKLNRHVSIIPHGPRQQLYLGSRAAKSFGKLRKWRWKASKAAITRLSYKFMGIFTAKQFQRLPCQQKQKQPFTETFTLAYTHTHKLIRESWNAFRFNRNDNNAREKFSYLLNNIKAAVVVCNYLIKDFQIIDKQIN